MTFGSDAGSMAPEGGFLESNPHPRAYGNFARLLGKYVRDEQTTTLADAIHRLSKIQGVGVMHLQKSDIVRHRLVQKIVEAYEQ